MLKEAYQKGAAGARERITTFEQAIARTLPRKGSTAGVYYAIWDSARAIVSYQNNNFPDQRKDSGFRLTEDALVPYFRRWHREALPLMDADVVFRDEEAALEKFLDNYEQVVIGLDETPLEVAWRNSAGIPCPPRMAEILKRSPNVRRLAMFCQALDRLCEDTFYLSCESVQSLFQWPDSGAPWYWLRTLVRKNILEVIDRGEAGQNGTRGKPATYRFVWTEDEQKRRYPGQRPRARSKPQC